jgi:hypothetical protein
MIEACCMAVLHVCIRVRTVLAAGRGAAGGIVHEHLLVGHGRKSLEHSSGYRWFALLTEH